MSKSDIMTVISTCILCHSRQIPLATWVSVGFILFLLMWAFCPVTCCIFGGYIRVFTLNNAWISYLKIYCKLADRRWQWPAGSLFKVLGKVLCLSWDCSSYSWSSFYNIECLSKVESSNIFWVIGRIRPGIEHLSPGSLANTLTIMSIC